MEWLAVEEFAPTIPRLDIEKARHPDALSRSEFVKDNIVRTVMRLPDPEDATGPGLYLKRYKFRRPRERLKHLIVPTKPATEWKVCRALQKAGIPTCDVLAIAVRRRRGLHREGFLLSREIAGAVELRDFLRDRRPAAEERNPRYRRELIEELADLTARLVDGGFDHRDYHVGNLLIRPGAPAGRRLHVVDLHRVRLRRAGRRGLLRMLGMLADSTSLSDVSQEDRAAFLRAFLSRWRGGPGDSEDAFARWSKMIKLAQRRLWRTHMRSRTRRCVVRSTLFTKERAAGFLIHRRRDIPLRSALDAVKLHDAAIAGERGDVQVFRRDLRTEVTVCPCDRVPPFGVNRPAAPDDVKPANVCVKSFRRASLVERLKDTFRPCSRARTAWLAARGFSVRGVPAARPLALLESRSKLSGKPDYLITEALENDGDLGELAMAGLPAGRRRRQLGAAIADMLNLLAEKEIYHPDTKPTNFLVKERDGAFDLWLVDLDRVRFDAPPDRNRWEKSLARLNAGLPADVTVLDRMRCLRRCGAGRWTARERLQIARRVYDLSLRRRPAWLRHA